MDIVSESNSVRRETGDDLLRVLPEESGKGLPYAPENWPSPGDIWSWKVGRRVTNKGFFVDRYLYLPDRLQTSQNATNSSNRKYGFASKLAIGRYIKEFYPNADVEAFLASFNWKIPAKKNPFSVGNYPDSLPEEMVKDGAADTSFGVSGCRAGNKMCCSINQEGPISVAAVPCELCCIDPLFCRECCCILCRRSISSEYEAYTYVKCEAKDGEEYICGHLGHIECALRCFMAGKVGGIFDLDAEYMCRRCDAKMDLIPHVAKLFEACKSISVRDDIKKLLNLGHCILRGSQKESAKVLLNDIELAIRKVDGGTTLEDIWREVNDSASILAGTKHISQSITGVPHHETALVVQSYDDLNMSSSLENHPASSEFKSKYKKFEIEVDEVLSALRNAQRSEFKIAEEKLKAQKDYICSLFQELDRKKSELANEASDVSLMSAVLDQVDQVKQEISKLKEMEEVGNGFGKTSRSVLRNHFD